MIFQKRLLVNFLNKYFEKILCGEQKVISVEIAASDLRSRNQYDVWGQLQTDFYDLIMEILKQMT